MIGQIVNSLARRPESREFEGSIGNGGGMTDTLGHSPSADDEGHSRDISKMICELSRFLTLESFQTETNGRHFKFFFLPFLKGNR